MYSVVLATMLTAGGSAPDWHGCWGCSGSCSGCWGNAFSSCRCWGGCFGCWGCNGCRGCFGCWGCNGCRGCNGCAGCAGCYGSSFYGCNGCAGCACNGSGCWGCAGSAGYGNGCWGCAGGACNGGAVNPAPAPAPAPKPVEKKKVEATPAHITVHLPADAKLSVDGVECPLVSDTRAFDTPRLQPGQQFYYTVKAEIVREGKTVSESKRVIFEAGAKIDVEFRLPVETASR